MTPQLFLSSVGHISPVTQLTVFVLSALSVMCKYKLNPSHINLQGAACVHVTTGWRCFPEPSHGTHGQYRQQIPAQAAAPLVLILEDAS